MRTSGNMPASGVMKVGIAGLLFAALLAASVVRAGAASPPTLAAIGNEVQCLCGCNAPLNGCPHLDCAEKAEMQAYIKQEIAAGKDETAILQDLVQKYGVHVLSSPPPHGFNLSVWILPGLGLLVGLALVVVIVRRWRHKPPPPDGGTPATLDPKVLTAMEEEMKSVGLN
jgi:cytochrome c-type biogenesis protein CcmH